jgi:hypothetical protein
MDSRYKIITDTLKSPNGKWSRKSLTLFVSFVISVILGFYIVVSDYILDKEINKYAIEVFNGFMLLTGAMSGITVADKFTPTKKEEIEP